VLESFRKAPEKLQITRSLSKTSESAMFLQIFSKITQILTIFQSFSPSASFHFQFVSFLSFIFACSHPDVIPNHPSTSQTSTPILNSKLLHQTISLSLKIDFPSNLPFTQQLKSSPKP
jgi:hypothetical protein